MNRKLLALPAALLLALSALLSSAGGVSSGVDNCHPAWKCFGTPSPTVGPTPIGPPITAPPTVGPTPIGPPITAPPAPSAPTSTPTPTASNVVYTLDDEFTTLNSARWIRHFGCCGTLAGYDPALAFVSGGLLNLQVVNRSGSWYGMLLDTKTTFTQKYGYFEARIKVPKGKGLWPAWWMYYSGTPEIDTMEVCANSLGTNGGNDASLLHTTVHYGTGQQYGKGTRTVDLSQAFHVYGVDWRANHVNFYLDGALVYSVTDMAAIPTAALPLILNLGIGGSWCSAPDSTTPITNTMQVDWVRIRP